MSSPERCVNPLERLILLSADEQGRIPYFQWQASGAEGNLKALTLMEHMGYLQREPGKKFCRRFRLTELSHHGRRARQRRRGRRHHARLAGGRAGDA
ncbi:MAG TPA: hypothetical protein VG733_05655, partial [Chthoniobacteraceae bacterium]|nr:hypothetical protein [Chthoniobacteraceae bacterium]